MKTSMLALFIACIALGAAAPAALAQQTPAAPADSAAAPPATPPAAPPATPPTAPPATPPAATPVTATPAPAPAPAPATPAPTAAPAATTQSSFRDRIYYGGTVTFSFGDATRIGIFPMLAYKVTPKLSGGVEIGYEYVNYDDFDQSANNYGASVFARYRLIPLIYAHAEYQQVNYELFTGPNTSSREWVPFLLVGGGLSKMVAPRTWAYVEVLVDVLQDDQSPYEDWDPVVSVGIGVGF